MIDKKKSTKSHPFIAVLHPRDQIQTSRFKDASIYHYTFHKLANYNPIIIENNQINKLDSHWQL